MCRAVWPHMRQARYGRIVNTASGAMFGGRFLTIYGAAKGGIVALTRSLAIEGRDQTVAPPTLLLRRCSAQVPLRAVAQPA